MTQEVFIYFIFCRSCYSNKKQTYESILRKKKNSRFPINYKNFCSIIKKHLLHVLWELSWQWTFLTFSHLIKHPNILNSKKFTQLYNEWLSLLQKWLVGNILYSKQFSQYWNPLSKQYFRKQPRITTENSGEKID